MAALAEAGPETGSRGCRVGPAPGWTPLKPEAAFPEQQLWLKISCEVLVRWDLGTINFLLDRNLDSFFSILVHAVENQNDLRFIPADGKTLLSFSSPAENLPSETTPRTGDAEGPGNPRGWSWGAPDLWYSGLPAAQLPRSTSDPPAGLCPLVIPAE